jgi:hypothetical protein
LFTRRAVFQIRADSSAELTPVLRGDARPRRAGRYYEGSAACVTY